MVQIYKTGDAYAIAVAKSNPRLREVINRVLGDMRRDGTYALLFQKWFQVQPPPG
jgi:polar amino acid transport system substrate-binding protein